MHRPFVPFLLAPFLLVPPAATPASADCDPETGQCHAVDCVAWDPVGQAPHAVDALLAGDPNGATLLLPPPCPPG